MNSQAGIHLDTSDRPLCAAAPDISGLRSSLVGQSHLPPVGKSQVLHSLGTGKSLHSDNGENFHRLTAMGISEAHLGFCSRGQASPAVCSELWLVTAHLQQHTCRHGTFPSGFIARYSLVRCFFLPRDVTCSSMGSAVHLHGAEYDALHLSSYISWQDETIMLREISSYALSSCLHACMP